MEALKEANFTMDFLGTLDQANVDDSRKEVVVRVQLSRKRVKGSGFYSRGFVWEVRQREGCVY